MSADQYIRKCTLLVTDRKGEGLDLSNLHIKFAIKRSDTQTPNMAEIKIYNVREESIQVIEKEYSRVILQGGYEDNFGVIFQGNIKQVLRGRDNGTDTWVEIVAGDGDLAYNFAIVNASIAKGSTQADQINAAIKPMNSKGNVTAGNISNLPTVKLPRGKVMYGMSRDYLRQSALTSNQTWSIQDGKVQFVPVTSYLPGEAVVLTAKTGMIGTPVQTNEGVNIKCLLNPKLKVGGRVKLDNASIAKLKINLSVPLSPANIPAPLTADGVYYILVIETIGDNRGQEWYSSLTTLNLNVTTNPINSVQVGY